jgi:hypothetical protein
MNANLLQLAVPHLQITFTLSEYQAVLSKYTRARIFSPSEAGIDYWKRLPNYLISRCPFCGATYDSRVDTHGLDGWMTHPDNWNSVYTEEHQQIGCSHFVAVQTFVNLNGLLPTELAYYMSHLDVPFVMPTFVPDDIPSICVIHSLPIYGKLEFRP